MRLQCLCFFFATTLCLRLSAAQDFEASGSGPLFETDDEDLAGEVEGSGAADDDALAVQSSSAQPTRPPPPPPTTKAPPLPPVRPSLRPLPPIRPTEVQEFEEEGEDDYRPIDRIEPSRPQPDVEVVEVGSTASPQRGPLGLSWAWLIGIIVLAALLLICVVATIVVCCIRSRRKEEIHKERLRAHI